MNTGMHIPFGQLQPLIALAAGILILAVPRMLNYAVAAYFILMGVMGLFRYGGVVWNLQGAIFLGAGVLVLIYPKLLNYVVAFTLILIGLLGLSGMG